METVDTSLNELVHFIRAARCEDSIELLRSLLTPAEIDAFAQRLQILDRLAAGIPQREISDSLHVGIATVTRGSKVWKHDNQLLKKYFPRRVLST